MLRTRSSRNRTEIVGCHGYRLRATKVLRCSQEGELVSGTFLSWTSLVFKYFSFLFQLHSFCDSRLLQQPGSCSLLSCSVFVVQRTCVRLSVFRSLSLSSSYQHHQFSVLNNTAYQYNIAVRGHRLPTGDEQD